MARSLALRSWLPTVALLCAAACEHEPDVVARFQANARAGSDSPAAPGNGASAGTPAAPSSMGSGGTFEVAGKNAHGDAGIATDAGDADGGDDGAGSGGSSAKPQEKNCDPPEVYWTIKSIVDADCVLDPKYFPAVTPFVQQPSVPMGESRHIAICDVLGVTFYIDDKGNYVLCDNACDAARKWVDDEYNGVLRCMGLLDAGGG